MIAVAQQEFRALVKDFVYQIAGARFGISPDQRAALDRIADRWSEALEAEMAGGRANG